MRAAVALMAALALLVVAPAFASEEHPTQSEMEAELVCPTCHTTLDLSDSPAAQDIKDYVRKRIAEGATKSQIKSELVAQLGPEVLAVPRTHGFDLLAWLLPILGVVVGAALLGAAAWFWSRNRSQSEEDDGIFVAAAAPGRPLDPELERRVDEELARFDA
jgi:cytochrome c-type biogenesis protein CcmH